MKKLIIVLILSVFFAGLQIGQKAIEQGKEARKKQEIALLSIR